VVTNAAVSPPMVASGHLGAPEGARLLEAKHVMIVVGGFTAGSTRGVAECKSTEKEQNISIPWVSGN